MICKPVLAVDSANHNDVAVRAQLRRHRILLVGGTCGAHARLSGYLAILRPPAGRLFLGCVKPHTYMLVKAGLQGDPTALWTATKYALAVIHLELTRMKVRVGTAKPLCRRKKRRAKRLDVVDPLSIVQKPAMRWRRLG